MKKLITQSVSEKHSPYGEARRLAYFRLICQELLSSGNIDRSILEKRLAKKGSALRNELNRYLRRTGIMQSEAVVRGYVAYAQLLSFLRVTGYFVSPTNLSVLLVKLDRGKNWFALTPAEKIAYFFLIWDRLAEFRTLILFLPDVGLTSMSKLETSSRLKEHIVQTIVEWYIDLGLLKPISPAGGRFFPTDRAKKLKAAIRKSENSESIFVVYAREILSNDVVKSSRKPQRLWRYTVDALRETAEFTKSEVDPLLFAALPIVLKVQNDLVCKENLFVPLNQLIKHERDVCNEHGWTFEWNPAYGTGYIHARVKSR